MKFASIRLVTADVDRLAGFYAMVTGGAVERLAPEFAHFRFEGATLAISAEALIARFNMGAVVAGANRSAMIEFEVNDVDAIEGRLGDADVVMAPTDMPWGNRSMLVRDPDGNVVNLFARLNRAN